MTNVFADMNTYGSIPSAGINTQAAPKQQPVASYNIGSAIQSGSKTDVAQFTETAPKTKKKGPIKKFKGFIANIKKAFATAGTYLGGTVKGLASAAVGGSLVYTAGTCINKVNKHKVAKAAWQGLDAAQKEGLKKSKFIADTMKETADKIPNKALKAAVIGVGALAMGVKLWTASLDASQRRSEIEHRWTGHTK